MVAFYYLLRVGEYTIKGTRNDTKQTVQFKLEDVTFFKKNATGKLCCLPRGAPDHMIMTADGATLKLDNQKNGWKGVCVYHEANGDPINCPVRALGRRIQHIRTGNGAGKTFLSAYYVGTQRFDVTAEDISQALKGAARALSYPSTKGIPIERINTHSLRSGGANALALSGYTDSKNGTVEGSNIQGVYTGGVGGLFGEHVTGYAYKIWVCQYCRERISRCGDGDIGIRLREWGDYVGLQLTRNQDQLRMTHRMTRRLDLLIL